MRIKRAISQVYSLTARVPVITKSGTVGPAGNIRQQTRQKSPNTPSRVD